MEDLGSDYNESLFIPARDAVPRTEIEELEAELSTAFAEPAPPELSTTKKMLNMLKFDPRYAVEGLGKPFSMISNAALAPIAQGAENLTEAFSAAFEAGKETYNATPDAPEVWQAERVVERYFPDLEGGKKFVASLVLDTLADPSTTMGFGLGSKIAKSGKNTSKVAASADELVDLMRKADSGDLAARGELLNKVTDPEKFTKIQDEVLTNFRQGTKRLTNVNSFPVSKENIALEKQILNTRAAGDPVMLTRELAGSRAATPYSFRESYLNLNSPDDVVAFVNKRLNDTRKYFVESLKQAGPYRYRNINRLLLAQEGILEHNISDKVLAEIGPIRAFNYNLILDDIAANMRQMLANTEMAFGSNVDRVRFFKLLGVREQIRAELTLSTKPASKLLSGLNTRTIDGSQAVQNLLVSRAEKMVPGVESRLERSLAGPRPGKITSEEFSELRGLINKTDSPTHLNLFLNSFLDDTFGDKIHRGWLHALLSGTGTHVRNAVTNAAMAGVRPFFDVSASLVDPRNTPEHIQKGLARVTGYSEVVWDGLRALATFGEQKLPANMNEWSGLHELSSRVPQLSADGLRQTDALSRGLHWFSGRLPMNVLSGSDSWFKALTGRGELCSAAWDRAWKSSTDPVKRRDIYQKLIADPTEAMHLERFNAAEQATFQQELGPAMAKMASAIHGFPGLRWIVPFIKTPSNIAFEGGRMLPIGNVLRTFFKTSKLRADISAGGARAEAALGQLAFSHGVLLAFMLAPTDGRITGRGSLQRSPDALEVPRYSIKIGDKWVSYESNEVMKWLLGFPISMKEIIQQIDFGAEDKVEEFERVMGSAMAAYAGPLAENFWSFTLARVVTGVDKLIRDENPNAILRTIATIATPPVAIGISGQISKTIDPAIRYTDGLLDQVINKYPGVRQQLPVDVDLLGNKRRHNLGSIWSGINVTSATNDDVVLRLRKINGYLPDVPKVRNGVEYSSKERMLMRRWAGEGLPGMLPLKQALKITLDDKAFNEQPVEQQREDIENLVRNYNEAAHSRLLAGRAQ